MGREDRDLINAMDLRAKSAQQTFLQQQKFDLGIIKNVTLSGASVQLSESGRFLQDVPSIAGVELVIGATVMLARAGRRSWVILGATETGNSSTATVTNYTPVSKVAGLSTTAHAGYVEIKWTASYFQIHCYEMQINTSASETGATSVVTDNTQYLYYNSAGTYYVRIRAVGPKWHTGAWTDWTAGTISSASTALTLSTEAEAVLTITGTVLDLDEQLARTFFCVGAASNEPAFRAIEAADLPPGATFDGGTITNDLVLDDGVGDSPKVTFINSWDDEVSIYLDDSNSHLMVKLSDDSGATYFQILDSGDAGVAWIDSDGLAWCALDASDRYILLPQGTSFPVSPSIGEVFYRTDLDALYIYDGAAWDAVGGTYNGGTIATDLVLDDGSGVSPLVSFISGTNDDQVDIGISDDPDAGKSDLIITLAGKDNGDSSVFINDSDGNNMVRIDDIGGIQMGGALSSEADLIHVETPKTPSSAGDTGDTGDICWDANFLYICIASNTWRRAAHATWA